MIRCCECGRPLVGDDRPLRPREPETVGGPCLRCRGRRGARSASEGRRRRADGDLRFEHAGVLRRILEDAELMIEWDGSRQRVCSESDVRRLIGSTGRARALLVRELDRAAADRLAAARRPYAGSPQLRTLLRLVVKTVRRAVEERLAGNRSRLRKV